MSNSLLTLPDPCLRLRRIAYCRYQRGSFPIDRHQMM